MARGPLDLTFPDDGDPGSDVTIAPSDVIGNGRKVVTTAGTAVVLASATPCTSVAITAETDNTGFVVVGASDVIASLATRKGVPLEAGDSITLEVSDLSLVYIDATVSGDGVTYTYLN